MKNVADILTNRAWPLRCPSERLRSGTREIVQWVKHMPYTEPDQVLFLKILRVLLSTVRNDTWAQSQGGPPTETDCSFILVYAPLCPAWWKSGEFCLHFALGLSRNVWLLSDRIHWRGYLSEILGRDSHCSLGSGVIKLKRLHQEVLLMEPFLSRDSTGFKFDAGKKSQESQTQVLRRLLDFPLTNPDLYWSYWSGDTKNNSNHVLFFPFTLSCQQ